MVEYRKTDVYRKWLITSRDQRVKLKEKYRRLSGARSREQIALLASERAAERDARRVARSSFKDNFVGPPTPKKGMSAADYYAWRLRSSPDFYARELDRAQSYKAKTRPRYKDSIIKWAEMPAAMKEVKHLQYLISRQLERVANEND
jgi:hypothetical protein